MARSIPNCQAPQWTEPSPQSSITLHLRLITPLFGGGFEPREVDPVCIIRPATIRGHLRFWWRTLYGGRYDSAKSLFEAESAIWGAAAGDKGTGPGKVGVRVSGVKQGKAQQCAHFQWDQQRRRYRAIPRFQQGYPAYALHPFQGELAEQGRIIEQQPATAYEGVEFELTLTFATQIREEVVSSVTAWVQYGGIGARTRRGCGALQVTKTDTPLSINLDTASATPQNRMVTLLPGSQYVLGERCKSAQEAWEKAVKVYQQFRQGPGFARRRPQEGNRPGRSFYPEPDSIRRLTNTHAAGHRPEHPVEKGFPRADLGLPIVFHFKDRGDPPDATLQGASEKRLRMASPVITKPLATEDGYYRPLVLVLNAPHAWQQGGLVLQVKDLQRTYQIGTNLINLSIEELKKIKPLGGKPIREALLHFVSQQWSNAPIREWQP